MTKINRETNYFQDFVQYPKYKFFAFPQPLYVLSMSLNFGLFSVSRVLKPGFHIIAPVATVATVVNKMERRERFSGFHIIVTRELKQLGRERQRRWLLEF